MKISYNNSLGRSKLAEGKYASSSLVKTANNQDTEATEAPRARHQEQRKPYTGSMIVLQQHVAGFSQTPRIKTRFIITRFLAPGGPRRAASRIPGQAETCYEYVYYPVDILDGLDVVILNMCDSC